MDSVSLLTGNQMNNKSINNQEPQRVSFRRLAFEALPEMWNFQFLAGIILAIPSSLITGLINKTAASSGAITTANIKDLLLSWRFPVVLLLGFVLVSLYVMIEVLAQIHLTKDILNGEKVGIFREIKEAFKSLRRLLTPVGILILLYIFIAVPICGIGFSISLSESFYIPNFIMEVVWKTPLFTIAYLAVIIFLIWVGYRSVFTLHAVMIDDLSPSEGRKKSISIIKANGKKLLLKVLKRAFITFVISIVAHILLVAVPISRLEALGENLPSSYYIDLANMSSLSQMDLQVLSYRIQAAMSLTVGAYLSSVVLLLCGSYFMLSFTKWYLEFTGRDQESWPSRKKKVRYFGKIIANFSMLIVAIIVAFVIGLFYNQLYDRQVPVKIIAHRAGGTMASENSLEGLELAIEHNCYASEIDVQRTADGYYIINHDNDFKRLTGDVRSPKDMTLEEIRQLRIKDTTGSGALLPVPTLQEMLEIIKDKEILFIELKGPTADRQMVDDVVKIVREYDCVKDVALISLSYDVINYAETNYPEFVTGTLFFAGIGDVSKLNCDLLIMEEESASSRRVDQIHEAGKQAVVWTVNTEESLYNFLDSEIDGIITDEVILAEKVQAELDARTDLEVLRNKINGF
jgi:glycerophosphoryl diester phosphodiesterase